MIQPLFWFFAILAVTSALMTVTRKNPVSSALWLIGTIAFIALMISTPKSLTPPSTRSVLPLPIRVWLL